ncbi:MAG: redoxin family protein [Anaerolineae bacterium]|nr:redoxin family protein [Anaerolineae bacterium]
MTRFVLFTALLIVLIAACSPAASTPSTSVSTPIATLESPAESAAGSPLEDALRAGAALPGWATMRLTNAATGAAFALADFAGKTVYVGVMATDCDDCLTQQREVRTSREQLGEGDFVYVSLSVEPSDTTASLAEYAVRENFPWVFAVAPPDMIRDLVTQFGSAITDTAATPHFVISSSGAVSQLSTGQHTVEQLVAQLTTAAGA